MAFMKNQKKITIVVIALFVGLLHFIFGPEYQGPFSLFIHGYLIDILLPFSLFLLFGLTNNPFEKNAWTRGILLFVIGLCVELLQYSGYKILGNTADLFDLLAYVCGILLAVLFERYFLSKYSIPKNQDDTN